MKKYRRLAFAFVFVELCLLLGGNIFIISDRSGDDRSYMVETTRAANEMRQGQKDVDLSKYNTITEIKPFDVDEICNKDYRIEDVNGRLYRFCYEKKADSRAVVWFNIVSGGMLIVTVILLWLIGTRLIRPFKSMDHMAAELAKGNLTEPVKAEKSRFFGRFLWSLDMLREKLESDKAREFELEREKKTLLLSLSHDIKTPLSAIELYSRAIQSGLYDSDEKKQQAVDGIVKNVNDIKKYVNDISDAAREDFLNIEVKKGEFYLSRLMQMIVPYYRNKLKVIHTEFEVSDYPECIIYGDIDRMTEICQNIVENAIKYGDGKSVAISFDQEEDHILVTFTNSGRDIPESELPHIFDSFYRGSNSERIRGSGLGLYICRELIRKMDGDIYAGTTADSFSVTVVMRKM